LVPVPKEYRLFVTTALRVADIVLCLNGSGEPMPLPESFVSLPRLAIKRPLQRCPLTGQQLKFISVIAGGRNSYIRGTFRVRGQLQTKMRHLQKLGYHVCLVSAVAS
jgi:hypothetical protein